MHPLSISWYGNDRQSLECDKRIHHPGEKEWISRKLHCVCSDCYDSIYVRMPATVTHQYKPGDNADFNAC
jgi:hypothetical protein